MTKDPNLNELSHEQQMTLIQELQASKEKNWKNKALALIRAVEDRDALEKIGSHLSSELFFAFLSNWNDEEDIQRKLSPLLVGMPHKTFVTVLNEISSDGLSILRQEAYSEPIQHQLTLYSHEIIYQLELFVEKLRSIEVEIDGLSPLSLTHEIIENVYNAITLAGEEAAENIHRINNALAIGWNTSREDLIESLSFQKECWQKYDSYIIGVPQSDDHPPTGLFGRLYDRLNSIFSPKDHPHDIESLHDEEPATEALVKFSIWYLRDYWRLGLLPQVKSIELLDLEGKTHSQRERAEYRAGLFAEAQKNLSRIGLKTVGDLKREQIFSKEMLKTYIEKNLTVSR